MKMVRVSTESAGSLMIKSININGNHYSRAIERVVRKKYPMYEDPTVSMRLLPVFRLK